MGKLVFLVVGCQYHVIQRATANWFLMNFILHPWQFLLVVLAGWINQEQQKLLEYLRTENQVLREKLGTKRILLTDDQRRRLALKGKVLGRKLLGEIGSSRPTPSSASTANSSPRSGTTPTNANLSAGLPHRRKSSISSCNSPATIPPGATTALPMRWPTWDTTSPINRWGMF